MDWVAANQMFELNMQKFDEFGNPSSNPTCTKKIGLPRVSNGQKIPSRKWQAAKPETASHNAPDSLVDLPDLGLWELSCSRKCRIFREISGTVKIAE